MQHRSTSPTPASPARAQPDRSSPTPTAGPPRQEDQPELSPAGLQRPQRADPAEVDQRHLSAPQVDPAAQGRRHARRAGPAQPVRDQHHRLPRPGRTMTHWVNPDVMLTGRSGTDGDRRRPTRPHRPSPGHPARRPPPRPATTRNRPRPVRHGVQPGRDQRGAGLLVLSTTAGTGHRSSQPVLRRAGQHADLARNRRLRPTRGTSGDQRAVNRLRSTPACSTWAGSSTCAGDPYSGGCWDLVFTADDPYSRPDPYRGELVPYCATFRLDPAQPRLIQRLRHRRASGAPTCTLTAAQPSAINPIPAAAGNAPNDAADQLFLRLRQRRRFGTGDVVYEHGEPVAIDVVRRSTHPTTTTSTCPTPPRRSRTAARPCRRWSRRSRPAFDPLTATQRPSTLADPDLPGRLARRPVPTRPRQPQHDDAARQLQRRSTKVPVLDHGGRRNRTTGSACGARPIRSPRSRRPTPWCRRLRCGSRTSTDRARRHADHGCRRQSRTSCGNLQRHLLGPAVPALSRRARRAARPAAGTRARPAGQPVDPRYGYSEQIVVPTTNSLNSLLTQGIYFDQRGRRRSSIPRRIPIYHTLGWANEGEQGVSRARSMPRPSPGITSRSTTATSPAWPS